MTELKYTEILKKNRELGKDFEGTKPYQVVILSNIIVHQLKDILEYGLRSNGIFAQVRIGEYDNIMQESYQLEGADAVVLFWEVCNLVDGFQYRVENLEASECDLLLEKSKHEISYVLEQLKRVPLVLFNAFSSAAFDTDFLKESQLSLFCRELNQHVEQNALKQLHLISHDRLFMQQTLSELVDYRNYYQSKSLYTVMFHKLYTQYVLPVFQSTTGKVKKVLLLDCDNTLWHGILGEDGFDGIQMSSNAPSGVPFHEVQNLIKTLVNQGVVVGLCSKNNPEDVDKVLAEHPDMVLKEDDLVIKKVNWNNKAQNIQEIAEVLNVGVDSIVFVDDSDFEINLIKEELPQVNTVQVPKASHEYPALFRKTMQLFYKPEVTSEDMKKTRMYKEQAKREGSKEGFSDIEDYLKSLGITLTLAVDDQNLVPRISQMTQKTNQFNLTTKRYTESDIESFMQDKSTLVVAISVRDKFGDSGYTALCIVNNIGDGEATMDSLMMSCRILGRNIENKFMYLLIKRLKSQGVTVINASWLKTYKNVQVKDFYDRFGFERVEEGEDFRHYKLNVETCENKDIDYIEVEHG